MSNIQNILLQIETTKKDKNTIDKSKNNQIL